MTPKRENEKVPFPGLIEGDPLVSDKTTLIQSLQLIAPIFDEEGEAEAIERACQRIAEENGIVYP